MLLVPAPKNRTIVRDQYPRASIERYTQDLIDQAPLFYVVDRRGGFPISSAAPTRAKAWKDAAQRIAQRKERLAHD
jgi:hypothetical protein